MVPRDETHSECRIAHWRHAKKNVKMRGGECDRAKARRSRAREGERRASCATFDILSRRDNLNSKDKFRFFGSLWFVSRERSFHTAILNSNVDLVDRGAFRIRSTSAYP